MVNRIAGYVDNSMKLSPGEYIVTGSWIKSKLLSGHEQTINQYRNEMLISSWKITSVINFTTNNGSKIGLKLSSESKEASFEIGDIVVDTELNIEFFNVRMSDEYNGRSLVGQIENTNADAVIYTSLSGLILAAVSESDVGSLQSNIIIRSQNGLFKVEVFGENITVNGENPLEIRVDTNPNILLNELLNTMNPLRAFIVGVSKEYNSIDKGKKQPLSEPAVYLKAGSIRIMLSPNNEGQLSLFDTPPSLPYLLLYKVLATAETGDVHSVVQMMSSNLINARKHMYNLLSMVRPYYKKGTIEVSLAGYKKLKLNERTFHTIKDAIKQISTREVEIVGKIYAIDTIRRWFKIIDIETDIDWKIIYSKQFEDQFDLSSIENTTISVNTSTYTTLDAKKGIAEYINHRIKGAE
ncbi:hypothetical protein [Neobacillus sp. NPDC093127]|uniref:hypothetical protein n=1 Tax=Neobacillus sp. NPDC093127 TaxID=3364296 RepID=UPI0038101C4C